MTETTQPWGRHESERVEFKQAWSDTAQKTMIAFANTYGGTIYFGVDNDGKGVGVEDFDRIERTVFTFARNGVEPDMSSLIRVKPIALPDGKTVAAVQVLLGDDRPYAFKNKNWTNGGVFIRVGSSSLQAERSEIMGMAKDLIPWEERIARFQDLTFEEARRICQTRAVPFSEANFVGYGIADTYGRFTNFGLLLSDQNREHIKISEFLGEDDRYSGGPELKGSILKQREDALKILEQNNLPRSTKTTDGEERIDVNPWPPVAVREALTNCIVHRDFNIDLPSPTTVNIFADRMVFQTVATLPAGLTIEDLYQDGFSFCRNRFLSELFLRLRWMEKAGSGFADIFAGYEESFLKPSCACSTRIFKITLPKLQKSPTLNEKVAALIREYGSLSPKELQGKVNVPRSTLNKALKELVDSKMILRTGAGRSTCYIPGKNS
ncbi:RNA-binding domain-containing protein [Sutterella sp.]|uniref:RNA-binding domain-containing protein n=1 Tax=Sutterella sp. TaxID=1981025 RepID=UPI0026DF2821|nr:RNA-binding domain-containing protein [Sutterella sp.]MDO5530664.1 putative DNA binding domain-containing protein [Sutterella sp.]